MFKVVNKLELLLRTDKAGFRDADASKNQPRTWTQEFEQHDHVQLWPAQAVSFAAFYTAGDTSYHQTTTNTFLMLL